MTRVLMAVMVATLGWPGDAVQPAQLAGPGWTLNVVGQDGDSGYVSQEPGTATFFQDAAWRGVTGLLAHDYLAGGLFGELRPGDRLGLVYRGGMGRAYVVTGTMAVWPRGEEEKREVFRAMYGVRGQLVLQTCAAGGGFLFVTAVETGLWQGLERLEMPRRVWVSVSGETGKG